MSAYGSGIFEVPNPPVPYRGPIQGPLQPGCMIFINGHVLHDCQRFDVNLVTANSDIVLHVNPRLNEGCIVRNTRTNGSWGREERQGGLPLKKNSLFECILLVQPEHFKIAFNGQHFAEYNHRMPKESVTSIEIVGGVTLNKVTFQGTPPPAGYAPQPGYNPQPGAAPFAKMPQPFMPVPGQVPPGQQASYYNPPTAPGYRSPAGQYGPPPPYQPNVAIPPSEPSPPATPAGPPIYNPPVPFYGNLSGGMCERKEIYISGTPHNGANRFTINFLCDQNENDIAFHFDIRFNHQGDRKTLVGNSRQRDAWEKEVRPQQFHFHPGQSFDIRIRCGRNKYKVFAGHHLLMEFPHRIRPIQRAVLLKIDGDVKLTSVRL